MSVPPVNIFNNKEAFDGLHSSKSINVPKFLLPEDSSFVKSVAHMFPQANQENIRQIATGLYQSMTNMMIEQIKKDEQKSKERRMKFLRQLNGEE